MPVHWGRDGKLGYKPAYDTDWNRYQEYKALEGTFFLPCQLYFYSVSL